MDAEDFRLLLDHLQHQEERLLAALRGASEGRGGRFIDLAGSYVSRAATVRQTLPSLHAAATDPLLRDAIERKALHLRSALSILHIWIVHFADDVGRQDVPVGVMYLVDELLTKMRMGDSDPIVHIDDNYMYSVVSPVEQWASDLSVCNVTYSDPVRPVMFNLPGSDPYNVLLSPILAHEVGHPCVQVNDLLADFDKRVDHAALKPVFDACLAAGATPSWMNKVWSSWVEELLCDVLAVAATGPSMLFASLAFLPGSVAGLFGEEHPDPAHRILITLKCLDRMGWTGFLADEVPEVTRWAEHLCAAPTHNSVPSQLRELSAAVPLVIDELWNVAEDIVADNAFVPSDYAEDGPAAVGLLEEGIVPAEREGQGISSWSIVLATWTHLFRKNGPVPDALAVAVSDPAANGTSLKAIELSGVLRLWRASDTAPA